MKPWTLLKGVYTALVTPMQASGAVDGAAVDQLVDAQLAAGVAGLVVNGTTGEAATLTLPERHALLRRVVQRVAGRTVVMAGTGASSTGATIEEHQAAEALGADVSLVVTPPYNRPNDRGLCAHYDAVGASAKLPILLYNVPSRTGRDMGPKLVAELATRPYVAGIKDANSNLARVATLRAALLQRPKSHSPFALLSGDDATAAAYCAIGGDGVVSVASNVVPAAMVELVNLAHAGQREALMAMAQRLLPLLQALDVDVNPIPVKALHEALCGREAHFRLPLVPLDSATTTQLLQHAHALLGQAATPTR